MFWAFRMGPAATRRGLCDIVRVLYRVTKVGYIFPMVVISVLPLAGFGPSDYRKDAYHFKSRIKNWEVLARRKFTDYKSNRRPQVIGVSFRHARTSQFFDM